ncbi:MAG: hypothetical protein HY741_25175 [Chloroflexi bacterium]|nr:hypothetical protein [Chloroflexota bacterium]
MKAISVSSRSRTLNAILKQARHAPVVLESADGEQFYLSKAGDARAFYVGDSDDFQVEVEMTRKNKAFMQFLDERRREAKGKRGTFIEQVRRDLGLNLPGERRKKRKTKPRSSAAKK